MPSRCEQSPLRSLIRGASGIRSTSVGYAARRRNGTRCRNAIDMVALLAWQRPVSIAETRLTLSILVKIARLTGALFKWLLIGALGLELCSFLIIATTNYIIYGHVREGSRAHYDPYTLFLQAPEIRPTAHNAVSPTPDKNRTIWMFGGSTMRGATRHDDRTIPSFVSAYLNAHGDGLHFTVVNFGINSFNSLLESKYLEKALIEHRPLPNLIVFYDGANDAAYFAQYRTADAHYGYRRVSSLIDGYYRSWLGIFKPITTAIYSSFTRELYNKLHQVALPLDPNSPALREMATKTAQRYDFIDRLAAGFGAKFALIWQPIRWTEGCTIAPAIAKQEQSGLINSAALQTVRSNFRTAYSAIGKAVNGKPYFTSFATVLCNRTAPSYKVDGVHLTDVGRRTAGDAIGKMLLDRFFSQKN